MKFNTSGKLLTEGFFNDFMRWIFDIVQAGKGIRLEKGNGKIIISSDAVGGAVGGSGTPPWVATLPAIPTTEGTALTVYWALSTEMEGAVGDGQYWQTRTGMEEWVPLWFLTDHEGTPSP